MEISLNPLELEALDGLPLLARCLYVFALKVHLDRNGMVGYQPKISWQILSHWLYVEAHPGMKGGSPSKTQLRRAAEWLEKARLLINQTREKQLIFKCPLAVRDYCAQNKADTNPTHKGDTKPTDKTSCDNNTLGEITPKSRQNKTAKADTISKVLYGYDHTSLDHLEIRDQEIERLNVFCSDEIPECPEGWIRYFITQGFSKQAAQTAKTIALFENWCQQKLSVGVVQQAISIAEATLGQKPNSPMYYHSFVQSLLQEKQRYQPTPQQQPTTTRRTTDDRSKRKSAAQIMWDSCKGGLRGTDLDPDLKARH